MSPCCAPIGRLSPLRCLFTSPSCSGTHFLYLSNSPSGNLLPIIPCLYLIKLYWVVKMFSRFHIVQMQCIKNKLYIVLRGPIWRVDLIPTAVSISWPGQTGRRAVLCWSDKRFLFSLQQLSHNQGRSYFKLMNQRQNIYTIFLQNKFSLL